MKGFGFLILIVICNCTVFSQVVARPKFNQQPVTYFSKKENSFFAFSDTNELYQYSLLKRQWIKRPFYTNGLGKNIVSYIPMNTSKADFFVAPGCGTVFKYDASGLERLDSSWEHQNQHMALRFTRGDTLFFFGGYGLFTNKRILTYFTEKNKEWLLYPKRKYEGYYLKNGFELISNNRIFIYNCYKTLYEHSKTGVVSQHVYELTEHFTFEPKFRIPKTFIEVGPNGLFFKDIGVPYLLDVDKRQFIRITNFWSSNVRTNTISADRKNVLLVHGPSHQNTYWYLSVIKLNLDFNDTIDSLPIANSNSEDTVFLWISVIALILVLFISIVWKVRVMSQKRKLTLNYFEELLYNKLKTGDWIENQELVSAVSKPENSYEANKKRKDIQLQSLIEKLADYTEVSFDHVLEKKKDSLDRRMLLFRLKPEVLERLKK